jgi:two-component sensor histidine kinase
VDAQWSGAMLHDLVNGELAPFGARVIAVGPAVHVNAQMSQHLAMALHELATNAVKYGALSQASGSVRVEWRVFSREEEQRFRLCWRETGGPPVCKPAREGFGQKLLRRLLGSALSAQPTIEYAPEGLRYRFECELSRIGTLPVFKKV